MCWVNGRTVTSRDILKILNSNLVTSTEPWNENCKFRILQANKATTFIFISNRIPKIDWSIRYFHVPFALSENERKCHTFFSIGLYSMTEPDHNFCINSSVINLECSVKFTRPRSSVQEDRERELPALSKFVCNFENGFTLWCSSL